MASIRACDLDETNLDLDGREILNRAKRLCPGRPRTNHVSDDVRQELTPTDRAVAASQESTAHALPVS